MKPKRVAKRYTVPIAVKPPTKAYLERVRELASLVEDRRLTFDETVSTALQWLEKALLRTHEGQERERRKARIKDQL